MNKDIDQTKPDEAEEVEEVEEVEEETEDTEEVPVNEEADNSEADEAEEVEEDSVEESEEEEDLLTRLGFSSEEELINALKRDDEGDEEPEVEEDTTALEDRIATLEAQLRQRDEEAQRNTRTNEIRGVLETKGVSSANAAKVIALAGVYNVDLYDEEADIEEGINTILSDNQALVGGGTRSNDEGDPHIGEVDLDKVKNHFRQYFSW